MEYIVLWLFLSVVAGMIASKKGRSFFWFFLLGILLSPVIGIISALIADKNMEAKGFIKCPECAEFVKSEAKSCKHCGTRLK